MNSRTSGRKWFDVVILCAVITCVLRCVPEDVDVKPVGDAVSGAKLFASGDGNNPGCQSCHCPDAGGGCRLSAPNIQGKSYDLIHARTRDLNVTHPGGKFNFSDQDIADIEAYLATLP